jgi:hypothetical protein
MRRHPVREPKPKMPDDSPLSREFVFFADAMRLSIGIAKLEERRARELAQQLEKPPDSSVGNEDIVALLVASIWSVVDGVHRLRELLQRAPGLKRKLPQLQLFLRNTSNVEPLRHYVQHLRTEIARLPAQPTPIWGVISWVSSADRSLCYTVIAGTTFSGTSVYSCPWDTWNGCFAQEFILSVNNTTVDIPSLVADIEAIEPLLEQWAADGGCPRRSTYTVLGASFVPRADVTR